LHVSTTHCDKLDKNNCLPLPCFRHDLAGSQTLLSRSHVSSMTGRCTCPISYQGVVSLEKGSVIIRYKLAELIKKIWRGTPPSRSHVSSMDIVGSRTLLSRSHVSSMTGGCNGPIYYQRAVSVGKGSVIIRFKKN